MASGEVECWSEGGQLDSVVVFRPAELDVATPEEAAAVGFSQVVTRAAADEAFGRLRETLESFGCKTVDLGDFLSPADRAVSDTSVNRVFVRDTAVALGSRLVRGTAAFPARVAEFDVAHGALSRLMGQPAEDAAWAASARVEFGDVFLLGQGRLLVNVGLRSDQQSVQDFVEVAWGAGFEEVAVVRIPESLGIIHLDLAFNVLGPEAVVARAFLRHCPLRVCVRGQPPRWESFEGYFAQRGQRVLAFEPGSTHPFLSNYIYLGPRLILASEGVAPHLRPLARDFGIEVASVEVEALERGNGSVRCLTMPLRRRVG
ncbi:arginine deiminase family protein [Myxococcus sp. RHSTA-1-4]|uniref:arginine deiminase family protein n=1 Tax=Myxococcus sp. RHSTA-1-4 TaxID=2874601 RepID=UPI001CBE59CB|nr:arginine deiminase family protein [Myxococcus sp. RHSTA-1-4]MBZ4418507.1 amidinotransferase [Myxococcus sp. RHSTA-1-4]